MDRVALATPRWFGHVFSRTAAHARSAFGVSGRNGANVVATVVVASAIENVTLLGGQLQDVHLVQQKIRFGSTAAIQSLAQRMSFALMADGPHGVNGRFAQHLAREV